MEYIQGAYETSQHDYTLWPEEQLHNKKAHVMEIISSSSENLPLRHLKTELARITFELSMREQEKTNETVDAF